MSIHETPKLETVETLAGEASELLRDLIASCQHAFKLEPTMRPVFNRPHRRPINRSTDIKYLVRHGERVKRVADNCTSDEVLMRLAHWLADIEREITKEVERADGLPAREPEFAETLRHYANWLVVLVSAITYGRASALLAAAAAFKLPPEGEFFERSDILYWARQNGLGKTENNLRSRLARNEGFKRDGVLSRDGLIRFLYDLRDNTRQPRAP